MNKWNKTLADQAYEQSERSKTAMGLAAYLDGFEQEKGKNLKDTTIKKKFDGIDAFCTSMKMVVQI